VNASPKIVNSEITYTFHTLVGSMFTKNKEMSLKLDDDKEIKSKVISHHSKSQSIMFYPFITDNIMEIISGLTLEVKSMMESLIFLNWEMQHFLRF
jgi:hypothetical protein